MTDPITRAQAEAAWQAYCAAPTFRCKDGWRATMRAALLAAEKARPFAAKLAEAEQDKLADLTDRWAEERRVLTARAERAEAERAAALERIEQDAHRAADEWAKVACERDAARAHIENGDAFRAAVELACDDRLQEYKHKAREAEAERDAARAQAEKLAGALGPFAEEAGTFLDAAKDTDLVWCGIEGDDDSGNASGNVCVRDYRYARRILAAYKSACQSERANPPAETAGSCTASGGADRAPASALACPKCGSRELRRDATVKARDGEWVLIGTSDDDLGSFIWCARCDEEFQPSEAVEATDHIPDAGKKVETPDAEAWATGAGSHA